MAGIPNLSLEFQLFYANRRFLPTVSLCDHYVNEMTTRNSQFAILNPFNPQTPFALESLAQALLPLCYHRATPATKFWGERGWWVLPSDSSP